MSLQTSVFIRTKKENRPGGYPFSRFFAYLFSVAFFAAAFAFAIFTAADGFEGFFFFAAEAFVFAVFAVAVTFEGNLEVLLEYSICNSSESSKAYDNADCKENALEFLFHVNNPPC